MTGPTISASRIFYIPKDKDGKYKTYGSPAEGMHEMLELSKGLTPTHVVFNGAVGALTGDNALSRPKWARKYCSFESCRPTVIPGLA